VVCWACRAGTRDFRSALAGLVRPVQNIFFITFEKADTSAAFPCGAMNLIPALATHFQIANRCTGGAESLKDSYSVIKAFRVNLISVGSISLDIILFT
jgi:hypothetical protein